MVRRKSKKVRITISLDILNVHSTNVYQMPPLCQTLTVPEAIPGIKTESNTVGFLFKLSKRQTKIYLMCP